MHSSCRFVEMSDIGGMGRVRPRKMTRFCCWLLVICIVLQTTNNQQQTTNNQKDIECDRQ